MRFVAELGFALVLAVAPMAHADAWTIQSGPGRVHLLELFSSEGCSSCPPAEAWLNQRRDDPGLWTRFVPIAWPVDYWDHLGWPDPWAQPAFTARQRAYAQAWQAAAVYTPAFVCDGIPWDRRRPWPASGGRPGLLRADLVADRLQIRYAPREHATASRRVWLALLHADARREVARGENAGRTLDHHFVAAGLQSQAMQFRDGIWSATFTGLVTTGMAALATWVTPTNTLSAEQAAGGWLSRD